MKNKKIIIQILLFLIIFSHLILAIDSGEEIKKQIGVNPNDVTTDVNKMKSDYLKQQWTDFIAQNKVTKPINDFFLKISPLFTILFAHPYEISLTLVGIIILWSLIALISTKILRSTKLVNEWTALGIGIALAIIFAQTTILNVSTTFALDIIFSPDNWWIRSIMIVLVFGFLTVSYVVSQLIAKHIKEQRTKTNEEETERKVKELKGFTGQIKKNKY